MFFFFFLHLDLLFSSFFFFNDTATTEIYTLSLHDALPILAVLLAMCPRDLRWVHADGHNAHTARRDRKSTRLNSSHSQISYAVFCLKKKKKNRHHKQDECHRTT